MGGNASAARLRGLLAAGAVAALAVVCCAAWPAIAAGVGGLALGGALGLGGGVLIVAGVGLWAALASCARVDGGRARRPTRRRPHALQG